MAPPAAQLPSRDEQRSLHRRLCEPELLASSEVCQIYIPFLVARLRLEFGGFDEHLYQIAADDAVLDLCERPTNYDPERLELPAFLYMVARRDLLNLLRRESRHYRGRKPWNVVELGVEAGNYQGREEDPALPMMIDEERQRTQTAARDATDGWNHEDCLVRDLIEQGERRSGAYAVILGVTHLAEAEQRKAVKRAKDRVKKRMEREGGAKHD